MPTTGCRPLKIIAFNANGIGRQAYEVRTQVQDLKIDALFSEIHLKPHIRFYIPNNDFYFTYHERGTKGELLLELGKASLTFAST
jgi:hypothetical protein